MNCTFCGHPVDPDEPTEFKLAFMDDDGFDAHDDCLADALAQRPELIA